MPKHNVVSRLIGQSVELIHQPTGEILQTLQLGYPTQDHRSFIISTWLKSYRSQARKQGIQEFYDKHEPEIAEYLWQSCTVATDEDGFTVYAWVCGKPGSLRHAYTIPELRMYGVCKALTEYVCGESWDLVRPWPFRTSRRINPYALGDK